VGIDFGKTRRGRRRGCSATSARARSTLKVLISLLKIVLHKSTPPKIRQLTLSSTIIKNKLTDLCRDRLLQNEAWAASKLLSNVSKGEKYIEGAGTLLSHRTY